MLVKIGQLTSLGSLLIEEYFQNEVVDTDKTSLPNLKQTDFVIADVEALTEDQGELLKEAISQAVPLILENSTLTNLPKYGLIGLNSKLLFVSNFNQGGFPDVVLYENDSDENNVLNNDLEKLVFLLDCIEEHI